MADLRRADQRTVIRERRTRQHVADNTAFVDIANLPGVWFFVRCVIIGDNFDVMVFAFLNNISNITSISTLLKLLFLSSFGAGVTVASITIEETQVAWQRSRHLLLARLRWTTSSTLN